MSKLRTTTYTDTVTGEVSFGKSYLYQGNTGNMSLFIYNRSTVNISPKCDLPDELGYAGKGMLLDIVKKFMRHDNILMTKVRGGDARYTTTKDIYDLVAKDQSYTTGYRKLSPFFKYDIIFKKKDSSGKTYMQVNPVYFTYGNMVTFSTYAEYRDELKKSLGKLWIARLDKYIEDSYKHSSVSALDEVEETIKEHNKKKKENEDEL